MKRIHTKKFYQFRLLVVTATTLVVALSLSIIMTNSISANAVEPNEQCTISLTKDGTGSIRTAGGTETTQFIVASGINYAISGNCFVLYNDTYEQYDAVWAVPDTTTNFNGWTLSTEQTSGKVSGNMTVTAHFVNNPGPYTKWGYVAGAILENDSIEKPIVGATVTFLPDKASNMTDYYGITDEYGIYYFRIPLEVEGDAIIFAPNHDTYVKHIGGFTEQVNLIDTIHLDGLDCYDASAFSNDAGHEQFKYLYYVNDKLSWTTYNTSIHDRIKSYCKCNVVGNDLVITWEKILESNDVPSDPVSEKGVVTPIPKEGYEFTGWTIKGKPVEPFVVDGPLDFEAHYQPITAPSNPTNSAQTGDNLGIVVVAIIAILGVAGACFVISRTMNKKNKKN